MRNEADEVRNSWLGEGRGTDTTQIPLHDQVDPSSSLSKRVVTPALPSS